MTNLYHPVDNRPSAYVRLFSLQASVASLGRVMIFGGNKIMEDDCMRAIEDDLSEIKRLLKEGVNEHRATSMVPPRNRGTGAT